MIQIIFARSVLMSLVFVIMRPCGFVIAESLRVGNQGDDFGERATENQEEGIRTWILQRPGVALVPSNEVQGGSVTIFL